jgi:death-on-curing protein
MSEPVFLDLEDVLSIHSKSIDRFGGSHGLRDGGLLESAVAQPRALFDGSFLHDGLFAQAAAYLFHIVKSSIHPA